MATIIDFNFSKKIEPTDATGIIITKLKDSLVVRLTKDKKPLAISFQFPKEDIKPLMEALKIIGE